MDTVAAPLGSLDPETNSRPLATSWCLGKLAPGKVERGAKSPTGSVIDVAPTAMAAKIPGDRRMVVSLGGNSIHAPSRDPSVLPFGRG